jgi:hypothetical protein
MTGVMVAVGVVPVRVGVGVVVAGEDWLQDENARRKNRKKELRKAARFLNMNILPLYTCTK